MSVTSKGKYSSLISSTYKTIAFRNGENGYSKTIQWGLQGKSWSNRVFVIPFNTITKAFFFKKLVQVSCRNDFQRHLLRSPFIAENYKTRASDTVSIIAVLPTTWSISMKIIVVSLKISILNQQLYLIRYNFYSSCRFLRLAPLRHRPLFLSVVISRLLWTLEPGPFLVETIL